MEQFTYGELDTIWESVHARRNENEEGGAPQEVIDTYNRLLDKIASMRVDIVTAAGN